MALSIKVIYCIHNLKVQGHLSKLGSQCSTISSMVVSAFSPKPSLPASMFKLEVFWGHQVLQLPTPGSGVSWKISASHKQFHPKSWLMIKQMCILWCLSLSARHADICNSQPCVRWYLTKGMRTEHEWASGFLQRKAGYVTQQRRTKNYPHQAALTNPHCK